MTRSLGENPANLFSRTISKIYFLLMSIVCTCMSYPVCAVASKVQKRALDFSGQVKGHCYPLQGARNSLGLNNQECSLLLE